MDRSELMRTLWVGAIALSVATACDEPSAPSAPGGVALEVVTAATDLAVAGTCVDSRLNAIQVIVEGPTPDTVIGRPGETVTIGGLQPGSYKVALVGFGASGVSCFGLNESIAVVAGRNTTARVVFNTFVPVLETLKSPTPSKRIPATWSPVEHAESYVVEWDTEDNFSEAPNSTVLGTAADILVADTGNYFLRVRATNRFIASGRPSEPGAVSIFEPQIFVLPKDTVIGLRGQPLCDSIVARVLDQNDTPVRDAVVSFAAEPASGEVSPPSGTTDANGEVRAWWVLGPSSAQQVATATVDGSTAMARFRALAMPNVELRAGSDSQLSGSRNRPLQDPLVALVLDEAGQPVPNRWVRFTAMPGSGSVSPDSILSDAQGRATALWTLGAAIGPQTVEARFESGAGCLASADTVSFQADARAPLVYAIQPPSSIDGNAPFNVTVNITDGLSNDPDPTANDLEVTLRLASRGDFGDAATLAGPTTAVAVRGVAEFSGLRLDVPTQGYTLEAEGDHFIGETSTAFDVSIAFIQLAAGSSHSCGLTASSSVYCWGDNDRGQLGIGRVGPAQDVPRLVIAPVPFASVRSGPTADHTCASTSDSFSAGDLYCWGNNDAGQLGIAGAGAVVSAPALVSTAAVGGDLTGIFALGAGHTCALGGGGGQAWCWGDNARGQLGDGTGSSSDVPVRVQDSGFTRISAGAEHTCASRGDDGEILCWGRNDLFQLGLGGGDNIDRLTPTPIARPDRVDLHELQLGAHHSCAVNLDGTEVFCWGRNATGQLGDGSFVDRERPTPLLGGGLSFDRVFAGGQHTCLLTQGAGQPYCVGDNASGQLGNGGSGMPEAFRVSVDAALPFAASLAAGADHACGLSTAGNTYCWGLNDAGQLGDGSRVLSSVPTAVVQGRPIP